MSQTFNSVEFKAPYFNNPSSLVDNQWMEEKQVRKVGPQQNFQPHSSNTLQTPIFLDNNNIFPVEYQTLASTTHSCDSSLIKITITMLINTSI